MRAVTGKTLRHLRDNVSKWREKGWETVGGVFKTNNGFSVTMTYKGVKK